MGLGALKDQPNNQVYLGVVVGFCGGFTTFSGFGLQFMQLVNAGKIVNAVIYGAGSPVLGILGTAAGLFIARIFA